MREMKDSGVEWIGEIPYEWESRKIKYIATLAGRIGWQGLTSDEYSDEGAYLITGINFKNGIIDWDSCVHVPVSRWEEAIQIQIKSGDLLITKDGTVGKVAIAENVPAETSLNSGVLLIRNNDECDTRFLFWIIQSEVFWKWFSIINSGNSTIIHLYQQDFYNFSFPFPCIEEQKRLADYLDTKCTKIDSIIEKQQAIIEKLKEYKLVVVSELITTGLNPNVTLKDSGIEWIGMIPDNWEIKRLKYVTKIKYGTGHEKEWAEGSDDADIILVNSKFISTEGKVVKTVSEQLMPLYRNEICTVLSDLPNGKALAKCFIINEDDKYTLNQRIAAYYDYQLDKDYFFWFMNRNQTLLDFDDGINQTNLRNGDVRNCPVLIPPFEEQQMIGKKINEVLDVVEAKIKKAESIVDKLYEYKKSLIYEVVTGKKEV